MNEQDTTKSRKNTGANAWLGLSLVVIVLDQLSKWAILKNVPLFREIEINPLLTITHHQNRGAAFSFLAGASGWQLYFFVILGVAVSIMIMIWLRRIPRGRQYCLTIGLALVLGGALGNVIDRALYGHVIDFILVHWESHDFPVFNVADSAISVGAALLIYDSIFISGRKERNAENI